MWYKATYQTLESDLLVLPWVVGDWYSKQYTQTEYVQTIHNIQAIQIMNKTSNIHEVASMTGSADNNNMHHLWEWNCDVWVFLDVK